MDDKIFTFVFGISTMSILLFHISSSHGLLTKQYCRSGEEVDNERKGIRNAGADGT